MGEKDGGLIRFLMREKHGSPFEHGYFRFIVKAPLFVVREHHRHRAGHSYNEWSGRYSKIEPEFYVPRERSHPGRQAGLLQLRARRRRGSRERPARDRGERDARVPGLRADARAGRRERGRSLRCCRSRRTRSTTGAAIPRSLMHFCSLRNHEAAQYEIRQFAAAAETFLERQMPITHAAFVANDRTAPLGPSSATPGRARARRGATASRSRRRPARTCRGR